VESQTAVPRSYLGRLAPLSRAVWLNDDLATALNANGISHPSFADEGIRDSTTTVRVVRDARGQERRVLLSAIDGDNIKKPWRELHALAVKRINDQGVGGPLALLNLNDDSNFDLWVGALVTGRAKVEDTVESTYAVPAGMLHETTQRAYELGVRHAEDRERWLRSAISIYRLAMETNEDDLRNLQRRFSKLKKSERQRLVDISNKAYPAFWTLVEQRLDLLTRLATEPIPMKNGKHAYTKTDWGNYVRWVARMSYEVACPHETTRQMRAYALGRQVLFAPPANRQLEKEAES
jgi:CRISPR system Cascade subunit CasA